MYRMKIHEIFPFTCTRTTCCCVPKKVHYMNVLVTVYCRTFPCVYCRNKYLLGTWYRNSQSCTQGTCTYICKMNKRYKSLVHVCVHILEVCIQHYIFNHMHQGNPDTPTQSTHTQQHTNTRRPLNQVNHTTTKH